MAYARFHPNFCNNVIKKHACSVLPSQHLAWIVFDVCINAQPSDQPMYAYDTDV